MRNINKEILLKKCPFCGSPGEIKESNEGARYKASCSGTKMCVGELIYRWFDTPEEAAEAWNTRFG